MRNMIFSIARLSGAVTMVGIEQFQKALASPLDTRAVIERMCDTLDSMADTLIGKLDSSKRDAVDRMTRAQTAVFNQTVDMIDPDRAGEFVHKTSEAFSKAMTRPYA